MEFRAKSDFLVFLLCCLALFNINCVEASHEVFLNLQSLSLPAPLNHVYHLHRTRYHFQPRKNWINDPNGPMYYNGIYHLFYQYNPKGAVWGNIVWAHSVSKDLVNWKKLEHAIYPSKPFDQYGCWSGSATVLPGNKPVILYTGIVDDKQTQVQNYAVPANLSDPYLRLWIKPDNNPLIVADNWVNKTAFRDPTTAWFGKDGKWRVTIGGRRKHRGMAFLYRSKDFMRWTKAKHPLHSAAGTGNWECPDFFPVQVNGKNGLDTSVTGRNVKYVFKVSLDVTRYEYYTIGTYDIKKDKYIPEKDMIDGWNGLRYDYGNFYASKSFFDPGKNRRILWGWANESDTTDNDVKKGWAGIQLIPRTVVLDPSGKQLLQWPVEELETLRGKKVELSNQNLNKGEKIEIKGITAAQSDVDVTFSFNSLDKAETFDPSWDRYDAQKLCSQKGSTVEGGLGPFGLLTLASENLEEYTPVFFRVFKAQDKHLVLMCSDASRSTLMNGNSSMKDGKDAYRPSFAGFVNVDLNDKKLSLRSLIDHSVVESFGAGGRTCITSRVYPILAVCDKAHLYAFNNGTETVKIDTLKAWSMNRPKEMNH
ncbi:beta-fructofuranosidase, insoluble isoenzyme 1 isoform X1 [Sesamum indicum]|uniref:Beta-fructofuranosidase, insoluble isoenzyme 1 isoform X1 n=1 Tax=Sesamum indicum TaxID=4182 RepID=A0A6I9U273_SESIN|nr:beta-fructofuranosidase, insoluble isoenzyme 1 isoform X1 [Sesamum indicum]